MRLFLWEPKRLFKTHIFRNKAIFSVKKCICPIFFRIDEFDKPKKTIHKSQKDILKINVDVIRSFLGPKRLIKTQFFEKKGSFPVNKCICTIFFRIVECDKPQETYYKSQKDFLTSNVQVIGVFLGPERLLKTQIF